jgi:hypothetical protein
MKQLISHATVSRRIQVNVMGEVKRLRLSQQWFRDRDKWNTKLFSKLPVAGHHGGALPRIGGYSAQHIASAAGSHTITDPAQSSS